MKEGIPVAIVGAPNRGKSTLLNALLGDDRAIVSDIPGTTRDTVEDACTLDGLRFRFIDTAGLRDTDDVVEAEGIRRALPRPPAPPRSCSFSMRAPTPTKTSKPESRPSTSRPNPT